MSPASAATDSPLLPSFRRQQLLLEFASLKHQCPDGIYLTPNPNDPASWSGVYFVRKGPYAGAILRFEILFPPSYPEAPPLVIFSTEIFHPLLVPLTTYSFSPGATDPTATYSASETERLPPGALSLRYGFPQWFVNTERGRASTRGVHGALPQSQLNIGDVTAQDGDARSEATPVTGTKENETITIRLLKYIQLAFEDFDTLDIIPLEAAGNSNAWHAWRSHRGLSKQKGRLESSSTTTSVRTGTSLRKPEDWNWDGVWEARVRGGIEESTSEALLFGGKNVRNGPSIGDPIRFIKYDDEKLLTIQKDILRMHGFPAVSDKEIR